MKDYQTKRRKQAKTIRQFRKLHRLLGVSLFAFFAVMSITGLLLGWKANSGGIIIPQTQKGSSTLLEEWLPLSELKTIAQSTLVEKVDQNLSAEISRIDARPSKGILKFTFENHYWEIQLDGKTGKVLSVGRRNSDLIEDIHDGSIVDKSLGFKGKPFKLFYTSLIGLSLLGFVISGFWLWFGPKLMRKQR